MSWRKTWVYKKFKSSNDDVDWKQSRDLNKQLRTVCRTAYNSNCVCSMVSDEGNRTEVMEFLVWKEEEHYKHPTTQKYWIIFAESRKRANILNEQFASIIISEPNTPLSNIITDQQHGIFILICRFQNLFSFVYIKCNTRVLTTIL